MCYVLLLLCWSLSRDVIGTFYPYMSGASGGFEHRLRVLHQWVLEMSCLTTTELLDTYDLSAGLNSVSNICAFGVFLCSVI